MKAARKAFTPWSLTSPAERADIVMDLADRMQAQIVRLGVLESNDSGGLVSRTSTDVFQGARFMRTMARYAAHEFPWEEALPGKSPFFPAAQRRVASRSGRAPRSSRGTFRCWMATWKLAMALATGNTIVLKPSPETSPSALELGKIIAASRVPAGVA